MKKVSTKNFYKQSVQQFGSTDPKPAVDSMTIFIENANSRHNRLKSVPERQCPLNMDAVQQMLTLQFDDYYLGLRDRVMLHFCILFSPRPSELAELTWMDLEWDKLTITRKKKNEPGEFQLPTYLFKLVQQMRQKYGAQADDSIFPSQGGKRGLSTKGIREAIKRMGRSIDINLCPKDFRTFLMTELSRIVDAKTLQSFVGHLDSQTSLKYYAKRTRVEVQRTLDVWQTAIESGVDLFDGFQEEAA